MTDVHEPPINDLVLKGIRGPSMSEGGVRDLGSLVNAAVGVVLQVAGIVALRMWREGKEFEPRLGKAHMEGKATREFDKSSTLRRCEY